VEVKEEWSSMTPEDREAYAQQILAGNFMGARRVGFLQEDLGTSSKAQRLKELCMETEEAGRKGIVYSYFRETIDKVGVLLKERNAGIITGSTTPAERQEIVDRFEQAPAGSVLICQVQAGGTGLNIQAASIVIFCEPQIKPSLTWQALSRVYRMGQIRNVLVYHLLCPGTADDEMMRILEQKKIEFSSFADESAAADAYDNIMDKDWISRIIEEENEKYVG
jgi:SNF2 family DNA or RNA helicase